MTVMSAIEKELIKATKVKPDKYDDRQDFLAAILKAMEPSRFSEQEFDGLTDATAEWHTQAVKAMNRKLEIPDFTDHEAEEAAESAEADEAEDEVDDDAADEDEAAEDEAEEADEASDDEEQGEDVLGEEPSDDEEAAPVKPAKGKAKPAKPAKAAKAAKPEKAPKAEKAAKPEKTPLKQKPLRDYTHLTGEKDKFGIVKGTQTSRAAAMYEKGATAKQISDELDGRYYNVLKRLVSEGHVVEKLEGGVWKLTHRDDVKSAKPKAKPVAKKGK